MMVNKEKSDILRIIKRSGKITEIKNWLNIPEVSAYKYLGININQSILLKNHQIYLKAKLDGIKRRVIMLRPSLVSLESKMKAYKTVFLLKVNYAHEAICQGNESGREFATKWLYQILKSLWNIKHNVSRKSLFENLNLNNWGFPKLNKKLKSIINRLTTGVINLRTGCLFSKYNKHA